MADPKTFAEWISYTQEKDANASRVLGIEYDSLDMSKAELFRTYIYADIDNLKMPNVSAEYAVTDFLGGLKDLREQRHQNSLVRTDGIQRRFREVYPDRHRIGRRAFTTDALSYSLFKMARKRARLVEARGRGCVYLVADRATALYVGSTKHSVAERLASHVTGEPSRVGEHINDAVAGGRLNDLWVAWVSGLPSKSASLELEGDVIRHVEPLYNRNSPRYRRA